MSLLCSLVGHSNPEKPVPIYDFSGICYHAFICRRCDKRTAASPEDEVKKARKEAEISRVMNGSRAQLGLPPTSWET